VHFGFVLLAVFGTWIMTARAAGKRYAGQVAKALEARWSSNQERRALARELRDVESQIQESRASA